MELQKDLVEGLDKDYPQPKPVTEKTRQAIVHQKRWIRGSVRLTMGRILTEQRYESRRKKALHEPL